MTMLTHYQSLLSQLDDTALKACGDTLSTAIVNGLDEKRFGDLPKWQQALNNLPTINNHRLTINFKDTISILIDSLDQQTSDAIEQPLKALIPWRKGPWQVGNTVIDTEWRSDWKWQRVAPFIASLEHREVLDVGCGNGYHCLRMIGDGAKRVIGIDPSPRFVVQFYMIKHFLGDIACDVLPLTLDDLPENLGSFDTTFSMGVFYHRRSPIDHLRQLKNTLKSGGQLVLETLVIDGDAGQVLLPKDRYAQMRNVWFLPSTATLVQWLERCGFHNVRCVDVNQTSLREQRSTDWMQYQSLEDFLDPEDPNKTIEGYPAPKRAVFIADN